MMMMAVMVIVRLMDTDKEERTGIPIVFFVLALMLGGACSGKRCEKMIMYEM